MRWVTPNLSRSDLTAVGRRWEYQLGGLTPPLVGNYCADGGPWPTQIDFHEALEFGIVLRVTVERQWGAYRVQLAPGDVWLCGMWEPHGSRYPTTGSEYVLLVFLPESLLGLEGDAKVAWQSLFSTTPEHRPGILPSALRATMQVFAIAIEVLSVGFDIRLAVCLLEVLAV